MGATLTTLLLTRPRDSAEDFATLAAWPGRVLISPVLNVALRTVPAPAPEEAIIVTSQHGVRALAAASSRRDWPLWCVGPGSLAAARAAGFSDLHPGGGTAQTLFDRLCQARPDRSLVHMRGAHVVTDLAGRLNAAGLRARAVVCYDQHAQPLTAAARACLTGQGRVVVPLFSPRTAQLFAQEWNRLPAPQARLHGVAISHAAAKRVQDLPCDSLVVADTPDLPGMLAALSKVQGTLEPDQIPR